MEILCVLVAIAIVIVGGWGFLMLLGVIGIESKQARAEKDAERQLDALFDGRPDVTYNLTMVGMKYETVVLGAKKRGYRIESQALNQYGAGPVIFTRDETTEGA